MRKVSSLFIISLLLLTTILIKPIYAAKFATSNETEIVLKIGNYYILYTKPASPYIDHKNRLFIPLRSIEDLMGGKVSYDSQSKTATVDWLERSFQLTVNSTIAKIDGQLVEMDTIPVMKQDAMFLPLRIFLDNTNINYNWVSELGFLHITDEHVVAGEVFENFIGNDATTGYKDAFHLDSYTLSNNTITIRAKNILGQNIPEGKSDIQPLVQFKDGGFSVDSYSRPVNPAIPEVEKDSTITVYKKIGLENAEYIISVGRYEPQPTDG